MPDLTTDDRRDDQTESVQFYGTPAEHKTRTRLVDNYDFFYNFLQSMYGGD